jgi:hypothetical protein
MDVDATSRRKEVSMSSGRMAVLGLAAAVGIGTAAAVIDYRSSASEGQIVELSGDDLEGRTRDESEGEVLVAEDDAGAGDDPNDTTRGGRGTGAATTGGQAGDTTQNDTTRNGRGTGGKTTGGPAGDTTQTTKGGRGTGGKTTGGQRGDTTQTTRGRRGTGGATTGGQAGDTTQPVAAGGGGGYFAGTDDGGGGYVGGGTGEGSGSGGGT